MNAVTKVEKPAPRKCLPSPPVSTICGLICFRAPISPVASVFLPMPSNFSANKSATRSVEASGKALSNPTPSSQWLWFWISPGTAA